MCIAAEQLYRVLETDNRQSFLSKALSLSHMATWHFLSDKEKRAVTTPAPPYDDL